MKVIYLDQNKWIKLAQAKKNPEANKDVVEIADLLIAALADDSLLLPLTATNIYETFKINNPERRRNLAIVQASLGGGKVFVGRSARLSAEVGAKVSEICDLPKQLMDDRWFLSNRFWEAFTSTDNEGSTSGWLNAAASLDPGFFLFDYWMSTPDDVRQRAIRRWSEGSDVLRQRVENRRASLKDESIGMRRKAYSATLFLSDYDAILRAAQDAGAPWYSITDIGSVNARTLIRETPIYHVEREVVLRLEAQSRPIHENDFRDMENLCAAVPYSDCVIAENEFINLARQAGLGRHYGTVLSTDLRILTDII